MKNIKKILFLFFLTLCACTDLEIESENFPTSANFLTDEVELQIATNSAYSNLVFSYTVGRTPTGDEFVPSLLLTDTFTDIGFHRQDGEIQATNEGRRSSAYEYLNRYWNNYYRGIAKCNNILDNLGNPNDVDAEFLNNIEGQVRTLRAFYYFNLAVLWGDVPLYESTPSPGESNFPITPQTEIMAFAVSELETAIPLLSETKVNPSLLNRYSAHAILARVALQVKDYVKAKDAANLVINEGGYELFSDYRNLFTHVGEGSNETVLSVQYEKGIKTHGSVQSMGPRRSGGDGWSVIIPTRDLVDSYETINGLPVDEDPLFNPLDPYQNRDPRLTQSIFTNGDIDEAYDPDFQFFVKPGIDVKDVTNPAATFSGFSWKKYVDADGLADRRNVDLDIMVIRLAEIYLILAESELETGNVAEAANAMNIVRQRAGLPNLTSLDETDIRKVLRRERKVELAGEGMRLYDIRRWEIGELVMPGKIYGRALDLEAWEKNFQVPNVDESGHITYDDESGFQKAMGSGTRTFSAETDYLWPYPQSEIDANEGID